MLQLMSRTVLMWKLRGDSKMIYSVYGLFHIFAVYAFMRAKDRRVSDENLYYRTIEELLAADCVQEMQQYKQHGGTTTYTHCLAVAYYSYRLCRVLPMKVDIKSVARGALLHDLFLYDWHVPDKSHRLHGFYHPGFAYANAVKYFDINNIEADIIRKHMWPLTVTRVPRCREAAIVCLVDKFCSFSETIGLHYKRQFVFEGRKE